MNYVDPYVIRSLAKSLASLRITVRNCPSIENCFQYIFGEVFKITLPHPELNGIHIVIVPLRAFDDINISVFAVISLNTKMFEIVSIGQEFTFLPILHLSECLPIVFNTVRTLKSNIRIVATHPNILKGK